MYKIIEVYDLSSEKYVTRLEMAHVQINRGDCQGADTRIVCVCVCVW